MKYKLLILLVVFSFASTAFCLDKPTRTYYNNKIAYKSLFGYQTNQLKVQKVDKKGRTIQAEIPVVNDAEKDKTQNTKGE